MNRTLPFTNINDAGVLWTGDTYGRLCESQSDRDRTSVSTRKAAR